MRYGVRREELPLVARDAVTGPPVPPPLSGVLRRALGASLPEVVALASDPRFLTGLVPSANVVSNAWELCAFFECLLREGELGGVRIFDPRTVRHATSEQSYREIDLTLFMPLRYGNGLMLGDRPVGIFGQNTPRAFGHLGFTNIFAWADPGAGALGGAPDERQARGLAPRGAALPAALRDQPPAGEPGLPRVRAAPRGAPAAQAPGRVRPRPAGSAGTGAVAPSVRTQF